MRPVSLRIGRPLPPAPSSPRPRGSCIGRPCSDAPLPPPVVGVLGGSSVGARARAARFAHLPAVVGVMSGGGVRRACGECRFLDPRTLLGRALRWQIERYNQDPACWCRAVSAPRDLATGSRASRPHDRWEKACVRTWGKVGNDRETPPSNRAPGRPVNALGLEAMDLLLGATAHGVPSRALVTARCCPMRPSLMLTCENAPPAVVVVTACSGFPAPAPNRVGATRAFEGQTAAAPQRGAGARKCMCAHF